MLSRVSTTLLRRHYAVVHRLSPSAVPACGFTTVGDVVFTANDAKEMSRYNKVDYTIEQNKTVYDAIQKFAENKISCLIVTDETGKMTGILSERDYICKVALHGKTSKTTQVHEICTNGRENVITATTNESLQSCMEKMLSHKIRHLPLVKEEEEEKQQEGEEEDDDDDEEKERIVGLLSIQDLVRAVMKEKEYTIQVISNFALGQGFHFGSR